MRGPNKTPSPSLAAEHAALRLGAADHNGLPPDATVAPDGKSRLGSLSGPSSILGGKALQQ